MSTPAYLALEKMMQSYIKSPSINLDVKRLETRLAEVPDEMKMKLIKRKDGECKPIQCAIARSHTQIITALLMCLQPFSRLELLISTGLTPLHRAAFYGHIRAVKCVLNCLSPEERYKLISKLDEENKTAVHRALQGGSLDTIWVILHCLTIDQRIAILSKLRANGRSIIQEASWLGYSKALYVILQSLPKFTQRIQVTAGRDKFGSTAVQTAALKGFAQTVRVLLTSIPSTQRLAQLMIPSVLSSENYQSNENVSGLHWHTAIHQISQGGFTGTIKVILELLNPDDRMRLLTNEDGYRYRTTMHWAWPSTGEWKQWKQFCTTSLQRSSCTFLVCVTKTAKQLYN